MTMLNVGIIQVALNHWIGAAVDGSDGRLVACTTPTSSKEAANTSLLQSLDRFDWSHEQTNFQATDSVMPAAQRLWQLFEGRGRSFKLQEISLARWTQARIVISRNLLQIPKGRVISYGSLAKMAGSSPRAVGRIMATNPVPLAVPCHRVIHVDGRLGKFGRTVAGTKVKAKILLAEGVRFTSEEKIHSSILVNP